MNKAYSLVWNEAQGGWCAVGETARRRGKTGGGKRLIATGLSLLGLAASGAHALPAGGEIAAGKADMATSADGKTMLINQHSDKLITNWQDFGVDRGERVSFSQPTSQSISLNRVIGANLSQIHGQLDANGKVFLVNPNGVVFGAGAQVNVGGLVASTKNVSDADFLAGRYRFAGASDQAVANAGAITAAEGGSVALLGARVSNTGVIRAEMGRVALGAGDAFDVSFDGKGLLNLRVEGGALDAQAHNGGLLKADGGEVLMTARAANGLLNAVVNNGGTIEAQGLDALSGRIVLDGGRVEVGGKMNAAGGSVMTRGEQVRVSGDARVDTRDASGRTGTWRIGAANAGVGDADGALDGQTLSRNLGTTNVVLANTSGDLTVGDAVSWTSNHALTLTSRKGDVALKQAVTASGAKAGVAVNAAGGIRVERKLALTGDNASLALNSGKGHALTNDRAAVTLSGRDATFSSNGDAYQVIHDVTGLRSMDQNLKGRYVLGNAIDGKGAAFQSIGAGDSFGGVFDGLGNTVSRMTIGGSEPNVGLFAANRGRIANLALDGFSVEAVANAGPASVGALAGANHGGTISNVRATRTTVSSSGKFGSLVGGLVGDNVAGVIDGARFQGRIAGGEALAAGGIAGRNAFGARVVNNRADVEIAARGGPVGQTSVGYDVGGLVGTNVKATVSDSMSAGRISVGDNMRAGGLVGSTVEGVIERSGSTISVSAGKSSLVGGVIGHGEGGVVRGASARGSVSALDGGAIGGFIGSSRGVDIRDSQAYGSVSAKDTGVAGGFIGINRGGRVSGSQAHGAVNARGSVDVGGFAGANLDGGVLANVAANGKVAGMSSGAVGGLVGGNAGVILRGSATGDVSAGDGGSVGGLVGVNVGLVDQSRSSTAVLAGAGGQVGGLVGLNHGTISASEATGSVTTARGSIAGGLVGENDGREAVVRDSKTSVDVTAAGGGRAGGFVGINNRGASIVDSESTGTVAGGDRSLAGGFAGVNDGVIHTSYTHSRLGYSKESMPMLRGGFVALNLGRIDASEASGGAANEAFAGVDVGSIDGQQ